MTADQHRTEANGTQQRMRGRGLRLAVIAPLVAALPLLAGCATTASPADSAPAAAPVSDPSASATAGASEAAIAAAVENVEQRFERWSAGDHAGVCELLSEAAWQRIGYTAGVEAADCVGTLAAVDEHVEGVVAKAEADGVDILTPYYWMPRSISVDTSRFEVDSDSLVYVPGLSVSVEDDTAFRDGPAKLPGWLEESFYVQLIDGTWTVVLSTER